MKGALSAPVEVTVELTNRCNLRCVHCFSALARDCEDALLTDAELLALGDDLARLKVFTVVFSGGEPLIRSSFLSIATHYHNVGLDVGFSTNGTLVTRELACGLAAAGLARGVQVSLDGASAFTHDQVRGSGAFDGAIRGIRALVEAGVRPSLGFSVMNSNLHEAEDVVRLAIRERCRHVHFIFLMPAGSALSSFESLQPSMQRVLNFVQDLERIQEWARPDISIDWANGTHCPSGDGLRREDYTDVDLTFAGCPAGKVSACIDCFGNVTGCDILRGADFCAGNIRQIPLEKIWLESQVFERWRARNEHTIKGKCSGCGHLFACVGGCPAFSVFAGRDIFWGDPSCTRGPSSPILGGPAHLESRQSAQAYLTEQRQQH